MAIAIRSNSQISYPILSAGAFTATLAARETRPAGAPKPRLLDRVREAIRARHYSRRTEKAYVHWIKRYIFFHGKRHPAELGAPDVTAFLTSLAVHDKVAASTQNQALSALLFLYREVLGVELPWLDDVVRAKRLQHLPVVLTRDEVRAGLQRLDGVSRLMALLLYGAGLRLLECCHLRVKDIDFATNQIVIRDGKGRKDRVTMLPAAVKAALSAHLERAREQYQADLRHGAGWVELPNALTRKYPNASRDWGWQWVFPATRFYVEPLTGQRRRHHLHESVLQRAVKGCGPRRRDCQARHMPHLPSFVCHPPAGREPRHPHGAGTARPLRPKHHDDLHPRSQPRPGRGPQPRRPDVLVMISRGRETRRAARRSR
jgi:integron integrase